MKLLIVEDHALVREGLLHTLKKLGRDVVCNGVQNAEEALALLEKEGSEHYGLCLLDLMLPGLNGMGCLGVLRKRFPALPVVIISALDDRNTIERAMRAGASGFISKSSPGAVLLNALRTVLAGDVYVPRVFHDEILMRGKRNSNASLAEQYNLTTAQMRVLEPLVQGKTNRQISELLGLTEGTIKVHVSAILKALNVDNRSQALLLVKEHKSNKL
ncbi:putative two-component response regulator [Sterolibacterium denitrificans]|uniref:Two-component response regulator n=2 Tax=Sterolibacterium denitrificans TaxID=157592 RepID=A0A7Z7MWB4_9PROT|nr:response regulator transcription factor [Sterolibacterium denitrificans]KYC29393.1 LuxR family transcriptional regulator [Sterolibacterium denitrificans]SMB31286.1 putative two-component response regulator [Sterolibacterium denitrificans]